MKVAAAYIRVSTDDQTEYSPDSQLKLIRDYAKQHDFIVPDDYIFREQDGVSGRKADKRPEFQRMISLAKSKPQPFEVILVWKFSRFARNQEESIVYKALLRKQSIEVVSISEPIIEGPFGGLIERIIEWMDEYYSIRLSGEVKRGMEEKISRGQPVTIPAFGYVIKDKQYYPDPNEAPIVQMIFDDFVSGMGFRDLAAKLNNLGIRSHRGNKFENRNIEYILRNPVYIGKLRWTSSGRTRRDFDNPDTVIVDGHHEAIIGDEVWTKAQTKIDELKKMYSKYARVNTYADFSLKGLVRCSTCGCTLVRMAKGYLQCHSYSKGKCPTSHCVSIKNLTDSVYDVIEYVFKTGDFELIQKSFVAESNESAMIDTQIQGEYRKLTRVKEAYENGIDTIDEYKTNKSKILQRISQLEAQRPIPPKQDIKKLFLSKHKDAVKQLRDPSISESEKQQILRSFVDHIVFDRKSGKVNVVFYY